MFNLSKFVETLDYLIFEKNNCLPATAKSFAENFGIDATTVTRYLQGKRVPSVANLVRLADYFNCTTDYLLGRTQENHTKSFKPCPPFSESFTRLLNYYGYNCLSFSKETGLNLARIYDWKSGKHQPSLDNVIRIADHFDCSVDFVLGREK